MRILFFINYFIIILCKVKNSFICGDHKCINKAEAKQYFEENLTLEVKIYNKKKRRKAMI